MIVIGLTGSLAMGKSTLAAMLQQQGVPVHDSDAEVHALMRQEGAAYAQIAAAFPASQHKGLYQAGGAIDRGALAALVFKDETARRRLENILHPQVQQAQTRFIAQAERSGIGIVALDIPLLFETGAEARVDYTLCATAPRYIQRARALARPGMTEERLKAIISTQMPDAEKRKRADFIVHTGLGHAYAKRQILGILKKIMKRRAKNNSEKQGRSRPSARLDLQKVKKNIQ